MAVAGLERREEGQKSPEMGPKTGESNEREVTIMDTDSPRGVLEVLGSSDSDNSSISSSGSYNSSEKSTLQKSINLVSVGYQWRSMIDAIKKKSARRFSVIPLLSNYDLSTKGLWRKFGRQKTPEDDIDVGTVPIIKPSWRNFCYRELAAATDNFKEENIIGKGGHAEVYKGCLADGQIVAVKRLIKEEKDEEDRVGDFLTELGIIAHVNHPNAARLIGFSIESGLHLVLQFSPHGSLADLLFGPQEESVEWNIRFKIAVGIADGLHYLHHDCHRRIIHRDIKASNILLTEDYDAQISDFGLAKWLPENWTHHIVFPIEGTFGYLAPEYFMHGIADEKTDVFAYGVLLLEILTGRRAVDMGQTSLVIWAKPLLDNSNVKGLADPRLGDAYDPTEMKRAMLTASMCIHHLPSKRPHMKRIVQLLNGEDGPPVLKHKPSSRRTGFLEGCDMQDYTCANYINDLNRHMKLALE